MSKNTNDLDFYLYLCRRINNTITIMATARTIFSHCRLVTFVAALMTLCFLTACSNNNEELVPDVEVGESVKDFKKVVRYEDSKYFNNDLDALVTFALDIRAVRWAYIYRASKGFDGNE